MPRRSRAENGAGTVLALLLFASGPTGCIGGRGPSPAELDPVLIAAPPRPALPDDEERAIAEVAGLALAGDLDAATRVLEGVRRRDAERARSGEPVTGLWDDARDLLEACGSEADYRAYAEEAVDDEEVGEALRRRLRRYLDSRPLAIAARRLRDDRMRKIGAIANRLMGPISRLAMGASLDPIATGRSALSALLTLNSFPDATTHERQALRAYLEFLDRYPDSPEAPAVLEQARHFERKRSRQLHGDALEAAQRGLDAGQPRAALAHLERAERVLPGNEKTRAMLERARSLAGERDRQIRRSFERPGSATPIAPYDGLPAALLGRPIDEVASVAAARRDAPGAWAAELEFIEALAQRGGDEDAFFTTLSGLAQGDRAGGPMARHAWWIVHDPRQNPYAAYRRARAAARRQQMRWLVLGRYAGGLPRTELPRPIELVLAVPGVATTLMTAPLRLLQLPKARVGFEGRVLNAAETYLARFPNGAHSDDLHRDLERRYAARGQWSRALAHHQAGPDPDPGTITEYRDRIATGTLEAADGKRRTDVRISIYRSIVEGYPETPAARRALKALDEIARNATPQNIRISKEFLIEHPALWRIGALGLRAELMDGDDDNGEVAPEGLTLIGRRYVQIALEDREPVTVDVPPENFTHFIASLEEASYRLLVTDERETAEPDPARDLFFERARLGLLDQADLRPMATSSAVFLGSQEKYGGVRRRDSILPVEVVVRGGLEDFGVAALPRLKIPPETPDAYLYR